MKLIRLFFIILFLCHFTVHSQQVNISASSTMETCPGNGSITVSVSNVAGSILYAVVKLPAGTIITSASPIISNLESGTYEYGYYSGVTFVKAAFTVTVGKNYSTVSPAITSLSPRNYTYCGSNPLGTVRVNYSGGNGSALITLLNAADNSVVQTKTGFSASLFGSSVEFDNVNPGTYRARYRDACGVTVTSTSTVTLVANIPFTAADIRVTENSVVNSGVTLVYSTPGDICSGIKSASLNSGLSVITNVIISPTPSLFGVENERNAIYKLEIQNGSTWITHNNLTYSQIQESFALPADPSKWGLIHLTVTYCGFSKKVTKNYAVSADYGKPKPLGGATIWIEDNPVNTSCNATGKVSARVSPNDGCPPYTAEITNTATNVKTTNLLLGGDRVLLDIGNTYRFKITDSRGTEVTSYYFWNNTTSVTKPSTTGSAGSKETIFINAAYFTPKPKITDRNWVQLNSGTSGEHFNKSALSLTINNRNTTWSDGFVGNPIISLESGPSALTVTDLGSSNYGLGNNLIPGTYRVRVRDEECFNEVYEVVLDSYFTNIELTSFSVVPSTTVCDRYVKKATVKVSGVGSVSNPDFLGYGVGYYIFVNTISGPQGGGAIIPVPPMTFPSTPYINVLKAGTFELSYPAQEAGTYVVGLSRMSQFSGFMPISNVLEGSATKTIQVNSIFPTFDLSKSGGIVCAGNSTGDLRVKVDNLDSTPVYYIKKETDVSFPAAAQTSPIFHGLTAGKYIVKVKTLCFEVEQLLFLRPSVSKLISGNTNYCAGGELLLKGNQVGPISSIKWTLPNGTTSNAEDLNLKNLTAAASGEYKLEVTTLSGCYFSDSVMVTMNSLKAPTGNDVQIFCLSQNSTVADLVTVEPNVSWYDTAKGGTMLLPETILISGRTYYGTLVLGTCDDTNRLAVMVTISDPQTPTGATAQEFCKTNNPKISDLVTNQTGALWYSVASGGSPIAVTTALTSGTYYASLRTGTCESPTRLAVTVTINDPQTPTGATAQEFCKTNNPKISDLVTNQTGALWYSVASGGSPISATTALTSGTYYASLRTGTCESPTRLAVTVTINDPQTPTGATAQEFTKTDNKTVADLITTETAVTWYDAPTGGNKVDPTTVLENNKTYYGSLKEGACESPTRLPVTVTISDPKTPTGPATQEFCKTSNNTVADLITTQSGVTWYDAPTGGNKIDPTTTLEHNKDYYASLKEGAFESPIRHKVTVTISDPKTPTGPATQEFCKTDNKTAGDLMTNETGVTWYDSASGGNIISSTTLLENNKDYYGSLKEGTCESPTRLEVKVILHDPKTPTGATAQEFTKTDNKTVADLITTETAVTWYDAPTGGNKVDPTTVLENNKTYYGSLKEGACESPTRLPVTVTISDPKTPTGPATQEFCKTSNSTVADLITTETGVIWYDAPTGGNKIDPTTALEHNKDYYASLKEGAFESPVRHKVTVTISDPKTPTGPATQEFCKTDNKTAGDLMTNETGVTWYDSASGGNIISSTTLLENNKDYYGSLKEGTCESPTRLEVKVILHDPKTPTGATAQEFTKTDNKTVADLITTETGVTWYDAPTGGNKVDPTTVLENNKTYYGSLKEGACESPTRLPVTVTIRDPKTPTGPATQEFCKTSNNTVADLITTQSGVTWYDAPTGGNKIDPTTALEHNKDYYASLKEGAFESPIRHKVTVTISDPKTPTGPATQEFCKTDNKTAGDLMTNETGVTWYDAPTGGNKVDPTTVLEHNKDYYGSLKEGTCESPTRLEVKVILHDPKTPTGATAQEFTKTDNKTVADLITTETGVTWYDAPTGGNKVDPTMVLENNKTYYGSLKEGACESPTRLPVTVTISDPKTPTGPATQEFCKTSNNTVADLITTQSGVTWYDAPTGGNKIDPTTTLEHNKDYYASLKEGAFESPIRHKVTVTISDPKTPTGPATQEFCKTDNKTAGDLMTNETGVTWYDAATGGNKVDPSTLLEHNKDYYGSLKEGTCESPTRLEVKVILHDPQTPTGVTAQEFTKTDNKTVADLITTETAVTWYDAPTGGNKVDPTTVLENNKTYYGSLKEGACESPTRLPVTVTISDPKTPTGPATQEFCKTSNNTVADLITTETGVTWYDAPTGGNKIDPTTALEHNKDYYASLKEGAFESPIRLEVKVIIKSCTPEPAPNWNGNGCAFDETTYKVLSGMSNYNWFVSKEGTIVAGGQLTDDYITVLWNSVGKAIVKVDYIDVSKFDPLVSVDFPVTINSCSDIGLKKVVDNANPFIGKEVVFTITAENFGTNQATDITISEALPSGYVYVASEASAGKYNPTSGIWTIPVLQSKEIQTLKVTAKVKEKGDYLNIVYLTASNPVDNNETNNRAEASIKVKDVIVHNSVSPNGDDLNDYLRIDGLDQYPNNSVEIFNSGGVQIFKTSNYGSNGNVFRGISEGRVTIDKQRGVPTGTYFYILRYEADGIMNEKTGYLYVKN